MGIKVSCRHLTKSLNYTKLPVFTRTEGLTVHFLHIFTIFENKINQHIKLLSIFAPTKDSK